MADSAGLPAGPPHRVAGDAGPDVAAADRRGVGPSPYTKHLLTSHVPVGCAVVVEDGVNPPLTRRALPNRALCREVSLLE